MGQSDDDQCQRCVDKSKAVFPHFKKQGRGKIINVASSTFFTGVTGFPRYVASKGAIIGLTRALAKELGEFKVTVNAIAPGYTETAASLSLNSPRFSSKVAILRSLKKKEYPEDLDLPKIEYNPI